MNIFSKLFKKKPVDPKPTIYNDDIFLVSYPKSGNTWVRFLIANLLKNPDEKIDFHTAVNYVPEIGVHDEIVEALKRPRILKSHQEYNSSFPKVIYLIRDPRDVYVSYYHYVRKKLPEKVTFSQFLKRRVDSDGWGAHVRSWQDKSSVSAIFKYEDLLSNTFAEVSKLAKVLNIVADENKIKQAIEDSSFSNMKKVEKEKGRPFKSEQDKATSTDFVRKGIKGDWINYFSKEDLAYLAQKDAETALRFGYHL